MRLLTKDDLIETYLRFRQRGLSFILTKFNLNSHSRTKSSFQAEMLRSGWWMVPEVQKRWNKIITGNPYQSYEEFVVKNYLSDKTGLKLLSLGCGDGTHELNFASFYNIFESIIGVDLSQNRVNKGNERALNSGLNNIKFVIGDVNNLSLENDKFDVIMFDNSLHHFKNITSFLPQIINKFLKDEGLLIINEYIGPNRLQWKELEILETNKILKIIPEKFKIRLRSKSPKNNFSGPGWIRMIMSDPSEAVDSESIIPTLRSCCKTIYEKHYGGNVLMHVLKDISHNFMNDNEETLDILNKLFELEDKLIEIEGSSLMMFGIYKKC